MNFCRRCGSPLTHLKENAFRCQSDHTIYRNPSPTAGVFFLTAGGQVLLSRRGINPNKGLLDSFGGFVEIGENYQEAVARELREELSLEPHEYEPPRFFTSAVSTYVEKDNDAYSLIGAFFWSRLLVDRPLTARDDVAEIVTVPLAEVDFAQLHNDDIRVAISELQKLSEKGELNE